MDDHEETVMSRVDDLADRLGATSEERRVMLDEQQAWLDETREAMRAHVRTCWPGMAHQ
ncbi:hypothetical protein [Acuticoccus sediminis]|nr:hypothetical protein [Acuticoccus sediminis]